MPGYVYRGNQPWTGPGPRRASSAPRPPKRTECAQGHDMTNAKTTQCYECHRIRVNERVTCTGCGVEMARGSATRHRKNKRDCQDAGVRRVNE